MSVFTSARNFLLHVRRDGLRCIPGAVRTKWMTTTRRAALREEQTRRAAETEAYQGWIRQHCAPDPGPFEAAYTLSILIPTYNTRPEWLQALADSLLAQSCPRWEACFCDDASPAGATREALLRLAARDPRFRVQMNRTNRGIAGCTNEALRMARGEYVALCDHDDLLAPDAVRCILQAAQKGADFIYTDEDKVDADGTRFFEPHCKPDFAPDTLRAGNYICHLMAMTRELANAVGGLRPDFDGSQDHDLALRATERAKSIVHIPRILYHWRMAEESFSHQRAQKCAHAAAWAVADQLKRLGLPARATSEELRVRIRYAVPPASVTTIAVGAGRLPKTPGEVLRVSCWNDVNAAAERATGAYLLFLAPGLRPMDKAWLDELLMYAQRPDVGCVGSAILDGGHFYRHAGYAVTSAGVVSHHSGQWLYGQPYMLTDRTVRNVTGVSSGLLLVRRATFLALGGFAPYAADLRGADLGARCLAQGLLNVYTPHARMVCRGNFPCLTEAAPEADLRLWQERFPQGVAERYYSPLLDEGGKMRVGNPSTTPQAARSPSPCRGG